ncbi:MAG: radical SAM family heme chaperone HemW [Cyanobacteria bacterium SIG26]|nr:radical SAM family heme chaperone HemW [Cyanobacteria bacterium SIG26]
MVKSAYIHIPFCKSKCHYCSFVSFNELDLKTVYLEALKKEIQYYYEGECLNTLYFGGGTPSILTIADFQKLLLLFNTNDKTEITTELNPESVDYAYFRALYDLGIKRISLGCQTFDDNILKQINRRHNAKQVIEAVRAAQVAGFENISLDFIYGLPNQTIERFLNDLKIAVDIGIQHISLYGLKIEEGCHFYNNLPDNLPDDDEQADMYLGAIELLTKDGFEHYEVSNFSLPNYNSRHNLTYWNNEEYYGFGVAAHGYQNSSRYENQETIEDYINAPYTKKSSKLLTKQEILEEEIFLGLRKMAGIDVAQINLKYGIDFEQKYNDILKKYSNLNLLTKTPKGYAFTPNGVLVSNVILADFIEK